MHYVKGVTNGNKQNDVTLQLCRCTDIKVAQCCAYCSKTMTEFSLFKSLYPLVITHLFIKLPLYTLTYLEGAISS